MTIILLGQGLFFVGILRFVLFSLAEGWYTYKQNLKKPNDVQFVELPASFLMTVC